MKKYFYCMVIVILCYTIVSCQKDLVSLKPEKLTDKGLLLKIEKEYEENEISTKMLLVAGNKIKPSKPRWDMVYVKDSYFIILTDTGSRRVSDKFIVDKYLTATYINGKFSFEYKYVVQVKNKIVKEMPISRIFDDCFGKTGLSLKEGAAYSITAEKNIYPSATRFTGNYVAAKIPQQILSKTSGNIPPVQTNYAPVACPVQCEYSCINIDWYYQEYNIDGILIYEEYLFTTAECIGGGGGNTSSQQIANNIKNSLDNPSNAISVKIGGSTIYNDTYQRSRLYLWAFYSFPGSSYLACGNILFTSLELGVHKYSKFKGASIGYWNWNSFEHQNIYKTGASGLLNLNITSVTPNVTYNLSGTYPEAKMSLIYNVEYSFVFDMVTVSDNSIATSEVVYDINEGFPPANAKTAKIN